VEMDVTLDPVHVLRGSLNRRQAGGGIPSPLPEGGERVG
jgi:hypothetical protein